MARSCLRAGGDSPSVQIWLLLAQDESDILLRKMTADIAPDSLLIAAIAVAVRNLDRTAGND
jgi:hypothetical protein